MFVKIPFDVKGYFASADLYDPATIIVHFDVKKYLQEYMGDRVVFSAWKYIDITANKYHHSSGVVLSLDVVVRGFFNSGHVTFSLKSAGDSELMLVNQEVYFYDRI